MMDLPATPPMMPADSVITIATLILIVRPPEFRDGEGRSASVGFVEIHHGVSDEGILRSLIPTSLVRNSR